jgi:tetratricopeptide (TPR) repeat protein
MGEARGYVRAERPDDAAFQLLQASRLAPDEPRVARELGLVFYEKKLYEKAAIWLAKAAQGEPGDGRVAYALGLAHEGRRDLGAAISAYREALRREPSLLDARKTLADALASLGEHEAAEAELAEVLRQEPTNELAAKNREVLLHVLREMRARRLLGKDQAAVDGSALVTEGALRPKGRLAPSHPNTEVLRYAAPLAELWVTLTTSSEVVELLLVLPDPKRAAAEEDDVFRVTIIAEGGAPRAADYATAVTLTFLREALGCPLTAASELYARLLATQAPVEWGGAVVAFTSVPRPDRPAEERHGIVVRARA